jgi:type I restriction enzyme S subunit
MPAVNQFMGTIEHGETKPFKEVKKGFTYFAEGDVIFAKITPCMQNGKSAIAKGLANKLGFGSTEFHVIRPNDGVITAEWIWYFVRQESFRKEGAYHFRGAVGQQRVPSEYLENANVLLPPITEQRRIVAKLAECMERIGEAQQLRKQAKLEARGLEHAAFHDAIAEGINECGWPLGTLGDVATSFRYGSSAKAHAEEVGTPVLRMGNITNGYLDYNDLKFLELDERDLRKYCLKSGDILINRTNSLELVGKAAMFDKSDGNWVYASYLVCVDVDRSRVMPEFVVGVLNSRMGRDFVLATARRAIGMVNINAKEMARFPMPLPPLKEQAAIVERLRSVRTTAESLRDELASPGIEQLRSAVLRKAFSGEL